MVDKTSRATGVTAVPPPIITTSMAPTSNTWWNQFFHSRVGTTGSWISGWMRVGFACLHLADRILWSFDVAEFLAPDTGMFPYLQQQQHQHDTPQGNNNSNTFAWNLFQLAPTHTGYFYGVFTLGALHSMLLLLGIAPRFQLVCLHLHTVSWTQQNSLCFDYQDDMMRMWGFLLLFLPLHRVTCWDGWGYYKYKKTHHHNESESSTNNDHDHDNWPMWPFRLWQLQITFLYLQSSLCKLEGSQWRDGTALHTIAQNQDFYGGVLNSYFPRVFRWHVPMKGLTWGSLLVELLCPWCIWPSVSRGYTLVAVTLLHLGIELTMNMHTFEWNTLLGWMVFLVVPIPQHSHKKKSDLTDILSTVPVASPVVATSTTTAGATSKYNTSADHSLPQKQQPLLSRATASRAVLNAWIVLLTLCAFVQCPMLETLHRLLVQEGLFPPSLAPIVGALVRGNHWVLTQLEPVIDGLGIRQGPWQMYCPGCYNTNYRYEVLVHYHNNEDDHGTTTTTVVAWSSPEWTNMTWYERKRWQRPMDMYTSLWEDDQDFAWIHLCVRAANAEEQQRSVPVFSIELHVLSDEEYTFPTNNAVAGWFEDVHPAQKQAPPRWEQVWRKKLYQLSCRRRRRKSEDTTIATTVWKNGELLATPRGGNHGACLEWEAVCHACTDSDIDNIETNDDQYYGNDVGDSENREGTNDYDYDYDYGNSNGGWYSDEF